MEIHELDTTLCYDNPNQPRKKFSCLELEELAQSIRLHGQLQPGKVRRDAEGRFMIVCGERRWRACQLAGVRFAAIVETLDDVSLAEQAIIENLQRQNISPLEEANAFKCHLDLTGMTVEALARRLGIKKPSFVQSRLDLLKLREIHQQALILGGISVGYANQLARLAPSGQDALMRLIDGGKVSSYKQCVTAADEILQAEQQVSFFVPVVLEKAEQRAVERIEQQVQSVKRLVSRGFKDSEIVIVRKVNPYRATQLADDIALVVKHLHLLEDALRSSALAADVREAVTVH